MDYKQKKTKPRTVWTISIKKRVRTGYISVAQIKRKTGMKEKGCLPFQGKWK